MLLVIESGIRGGIATISHCHAKANNEYIGTEVDPTKDSKFISYLWLVKVKTTSNVWNSMDDWRWLDDWEHLSCILVVDLEYPEQLYNLHNNYSLAPERVKIGDVEKLMQNLNNKTNYVVHYENFKL